MALGKRQHTEAQVIAGSSRGFQASRQDGAWLARQTVWGKVTLETRTSKRCLCLSPAAKGRTKAQRTKQGGGSGTLEKAAWDQGEGTKGGISEQAYVWHLLTHKQACELWKHHGSLFNWAALHHVGHGIFMVTWLMIGTAVQGVWTHSLFIPIMGTLLRAWGQFYRWRSNVTPMDKILIYIHTPSNTRQSLRGPSAPRCSHRCALMAERPVIRDLGN